MKIQGDGYQFSLQDVQAHDNPERFSFDSYFNVKKITVPQFNVRMGYYFSDHYSVSFGYDHMKYIVKDYQTVSIEGDIPGELNHSLFGHFVPGDSIELNPGNFHYENSDGLNYVRFQVGRTDALWSNNWFSVNSLYSVSTGMIITKNDFYWDGVMLYNKFHISGYGISGHLGVRLDFFKHVFLLTEMSGGMIHLPNVNTHDNFHGKTSQIFGYGDLKFTLGAIIPTKRKEKVTPE